MRADRALATYIDRSASVLFRRVKHFSGYTVAERIPEVLNAAGIDTTTLSRVKRKP